jgi:serine-type D-Ala-D-Ala carboxypeptidase (penicillin-binding protein 5/6)
MARRTRLSRVLVAITCCSTALGVGLGRAAAAPAATSTPAGPLPNAWIVTDAGSGEVLDTHNEHVAYPPASTTKIMTALTAIERLSPDTEITVSPLAAAQPASNINMKAGQRWSLVDAFASLLVVSANDAAYAIAEATSGSVAEFAKTEAATGRQLGMKDSTFADPAGLDDGNAFNGGPLMSAYDIAISTQNALHVPLIARLAAAPQFSFTGPDGVHHTLTNHNKMVSEHLYAGATGFKTGFTNKAGHTLVATATRNGRTLIAVVLDTWDAYGWAERLLDAGFAMPRGHGTGETLPANRITTYASRATQFAAFRELAAARSASGVDRATTSGPPTRGSPRSVPRASVGPLASAASIPAATTPQVRRLAASSPGRKKHGGGTSTTKILLVLLALLLATLYALRVRAVRRARKRRLARRRATRSMMRRGSLPVVDGRYRTGTRVGKPVESHVQLRREPDVGDAETA